MRKRILSICMALVLCLGLLPTAAWAEEDEGNAPVLLAANEADTPAGSGTAGDPYQIASAAELRWFRDTVNDGQKGICAKLTSDIDLGGEAWTPIGTSTSPYIGTFDGRSHVIKNFNKSSNTGWGLFGSIGAGGVVQALTVSPGTVGSNDDRISQSGLLAYQNAGTIRECVATAEYCYGKLYIGGNFGMIAYRNTGTIEDCYLPGNWRTGDFLLDASAGAVAAGMAYENTGGTIQNCFCDSALPYDRIEGSTIYDPATWTSEHYAIAPNGTVKNCYYRNVASNDDECNIYKDTHGSGKVQSMFHADCGSGKVTWLLNNNGSETGSEKEPWRQGSDCPTLDKSCARVINSSYAWETPHTHKIDGEVVEFTEDLSAGAGVFYLKDDTVPLNQEWTITGSAILCLNGHTLQVGENGAITVADGGTLTVMVHSTNGDGSITGAGTGTGISVNGGTLYMEAGAITSFATGVSVTDSGTFHMTGGNITYNDTGVEVQSGSLTLGGTAQVTEKIRLIASCWLRGKP